MTQVKEGDTSEKKPDDDGKNIRIEVEHDGKAEPADLKIDRDDDVLAAVRKALALEPDVFLFERDKDEPLSGPIKGRKALRLIAHKSRLITVQVRYEHRTIEEKFAPSRTVFRVLEWAVGKKGFHLDATSAAKANLILPGADAPLPRDATIGRLVPAGEHVLVVDLTLQDFTNG